MKLIVMSVYDRAVTAFMRPIYVPAVGAAIRSFQDEVNRQGENNEMNRHPEDYDLFELGSFDDASGKFEMLKEPKLIVTAKQMKSQSKGE